MSVKNNILKHLENKGYMWGGQLAREVHQITKTKESVIERRCRELVNDGYLEVTRERVEGKGPLCVKYKIIEPVVEEKLIHLSHIVQEPLI